jgi:2-C-methyl-D-erythritol 4-phosphate cytidylyltransferase
VKPRSWAVVPAAGSGRRMGAAVAKQHLLLCGRPLVAHALAPLLACTDIRAVVLVVAANDEHWRETVRPDDRLLFATGGAERCHSVLNGLAALGGLADPEDWVLVHDAARPCLSVAELLRLFEAIGDDPVGGLLALPVADTLKLGDEAGRVASTAPRENFWRALTPQMFRYGLLRDALADAVSAGIAVTDEAAAMERAGHRPLLVEGAAANLKVTGPADMDLAEAILRHREKL